MAMYPFLTGFWVASGASIATLFYALYFHDTRGSLALMDPFFLQVLTVVTYAGPVAGLFVAWRHCSHRRFCRSKPEIIRRYLTGVTFGVVVSIAGALYILPALR